MKLLISETFVGQGQPLIALTFIESTTIPSFEMMWPRNPRLSNQNSHLLN